METPVWPRQVRHNFLVNLIDGSLFGLGMGFASYVTIIPLFVASLTDSTILIGLIATIHTLGWQLPQLFMTGRMSRLTRYRPMVLAMTLHERLPMFGLGLLALLAPTLERSTALLIVFILILWQSLGAGLTANAWQSMIAKILPASLRGTFYGVQSGGANLLSSGAALLGGSLLLLPYPINFAICFFLTGTAFMLSWLFLAMTREDVHESLPETQKRSLRASVDEWLVVMRSDANFRWYVAARAVMQFGQMGAAFYTVYALRAFGLDAQTTGLLTSAMLLAQMAASALLGYLGDRFGHRYMLGIGCLAAVMAAALAMGATSILWFYPVFALTGVVNATQWTSVLAFTSEFGDDRTRPYYVGLANTLITPATLAAPLLGGFLADQYGFNATFLTSIMGAVLGAFFILVLTGDPRKKLKRVTQPVLMAAGD